MLQGRKHIVYDGNRRVTCLKLLANPSAAPTLELHRFFEKLRGNWQGPFPEAIKCQVEDDRERIDKILFRRHTGSQSGVGQSDWDAAAKQNFILRTGRGSGTLAAGIEKRLVSMGAVAAEGDLPRSNLNRLLSSEELRKLVGVSFANGKLRFTATPDKVLRVLDRIAQDLMTKKVVLSHIWNNEGKRAYLSELRDEGLLPSKEDELLQPVLFNSAPPIKRAQPRSRPMLVQPRSTLIPHEMNNAISWTNATIRLKEIWNELQQLHVERYPNSVGISLRVFLELAVDHYLRTNPGAGAGEHDRLAKKVERSALHLETAGLISQKYMKEIQRFANGDELISTSAMHRYIHSLTYAPSPRHLMAVWDTLSEFLIQCLNTKRAQLQVA
ncbi:hypothetical protein C6Y62_06005 [Hyphomicrobium sulfonivorans]|nr:hypothetical protein [Hyphomicrobium sulfonivorans]